MGNIRINFDSSHNPEKPTFILAKRNGEKLGVISAFKIVSSEDLNNASEFSFKTYKEINNKKNLLWDSIVDFKLVWVKEYDTWYQITVEIDESIETVKTISGVRLGEAELSQLMLYDIHINDEDDIARDEYVVPTVLFNEDNKEASLLHRITDKAPHYRISHVDTSLKTIQRTFTFDNKSIYDAMQDIAEEIGCLFVFDSNSDENGKPNRTISVYDLQSICYECGHRGDFTEECPECGSKNIYEGYGEDTTIFISSDELADDIQFTTDTGSVKNCFKLEAGDDLMTATIRNCNPNGTDYIWYISDDLKSDMSNELVEKIEEYDELYDYYLNEYTAPFNNDIIIKYNNLVNKYKTYDSSIEEMPSSIVGYNNIMLAYYNTVDFEYYLRHSLMPDITMSDTSATEEASKLIQSISSQVAVENISALSLATANSVVLTMAKIIVDNRYQVKVNNSSLSNNVWTGNFKITNYSDEEDTIVSNNVSIQVNDNYEHFVKQKLSKALNEYDDNENGYNVSSLFKMTLANFKNEIKKYCLERLIAFHDSCQTCINILIEQGVADDKTWMNKTPNLYNDIYLDYYNKLNALEEEMALRENEISIISGIIDINGYIDVYGLQNYIIEARDEIRNTLSFEDYLGETLWLEFVSYRREDKYKNENYISDGLTNQELFSMASEFINVAKNEIYKSAELQHSISTKLKNLLVIKKFEPLVNMFKIGNWIRVIIDDVVYKLRLINYEIDYDNLDNISVEFSDIRKTAFGMSDKKSLMDNLSNMATSYDTVQRQASKGNESKEQLNNWVDNGLALTKMKIIDNADEQNISWDNHGLLCRRYNYTTDDYDDRQLKVINSGLYLTDDKWKTSRAGIGNFTFYNPKTKKIEESYGVIADTLIGNLMLSKEVGIYNESNSISLDKDGLSITTDSSGEIVFNIQREDANGNITKLLYIDSNGNLVLNGSLQIQSSGSSSTPTTMDEIISDISEGVSGKDGESALSVYIDSSNGNIFKGNSIQTTLTCYVYYGTQDVTNKVKKFTWKKINQDGTVDESWNRIMSSNVINLTSADVWNKASFTCSVEIDL